MTHYVRKSFFNYKSLLLVLFIEILPASIKAETSKDLFYTKIFIADVSSAIVVLVLAILVIAIINLFFSQRKLSAEVEKDKHEISQRDARIKEAQSEVTELNQKLKVRTLELTHCKTYKVYIQKLLKEHLKEKDLLSQNDSRDILSYIKFCNLVLINELEEGVFKTKLGIVNLAELITEVRSIAQKLNKDASVSMEGFIGKSMVEANYELLQLIFLNLCINAINCSTGNPTIKIVLETGEKDMFLIHVQDSGIGIPKKHYQAIFKKYFRLNQAAIEMDYSGGLGLYFCTLALEQMGGTIGVDSTLNIGSDFCVGLKKGFFS